MPRIWPRSASVQYKREGPYSSRSSSGRQICEALAGCGCTATCPPATQWRRALTTAGMNVLMSLAGGRPACGAWRVTVLVKPCCQLMLWRPELSAGSTGNGHSKADLRNSLRRTLAIIQSLGAGRAGDWGGAAVSTVASGPIGSAVCARI